MRTKLVETNKPEKYIHSVRNADTAVILAGTPVVLNLSATPQPSTYQNGLPAGFEDGLQVVNPSTGGATPANYLFYGIALADIPVNQLGESELHGFVQYARVTVMTRGATNGTAASVASQASGAFLVLDTTNNSFVITAGVAAGQGHAILIDTINSIQSKASNDAAWSALAVVQKYRVFVRQL